MTGGTVGTDGLAVLAGKAPSGHDSGRPARLPPPPKDPVPYAEYAALRGAAGLACESLLEMIQDVKFYGPSREGSVERAERRLARLRALGAVR